MSITMSFSVNEDGQLVIEQKPLKGGYIADCVLQRKLSLALALRILAAQGMASGETHVFHLDEGDLTFSWKPALAPKKEG
jgi:hypothetical protein